MAEKSGWIKGTDGFFVRDVNLDGKINNGGELFGDQTVLSNGKIATSGFEAIGDLDSNKDGLVDTNDAKFAEIKIWQDKNQNGITDVGEIKSLTDVGVKSINLKYETVNKADGQGNINTRQGGVEYADGTTGGAAEFLFDRNVIDTHDNDFSTVSDEIKKLPFLRGYGQVTDLHHAMSNDSQLKTLVEEFLTTKEEKTVLGFKC